MEDGGILPEDGDFWTLNLDADAFSRLFGNTLVLSSLLTLQSGQVGRDLPQYMDFHFGGADSLRGYTVDDLG